MNEFALSLITPQPYPGTPLRLGSRGDNVKTMQYYLDAIRGYIYPSLGFLTVDGVFGSATQATVRQYQTLKGLSSDGVIGQNTWNAITADVQTIPEGATAIYPGVPLTYGSTGIAVLTMQGYLNDVAPIYTAISPITADGRFGQNTANAVRLFQRQFRLAADGIIGENTWYKISGVRINTVSGSPDSVTTAYPGSPLRVGSSGDHVRFVQSYMNRVGQSNGGGFPTVKVDGVFGTATGNLVTAFQRYYGLSADGVVGANTWPKMVLEFNNTL
ncbi:MAG: hypothetical protein GX683_04805 [Ruminococcaceae bacterium]|nr:hypothetical protein [Oscillospiraceae bacterium]